MKPARHPARSGGLRAAFIVVALLGLFVVVRTLQAPRSSAAPCVAAAASGGGGAGDGGKLDERAAELNQRSADLDAKEARLNEALAALEQQQDQAGGGAKCAGGSGAGKTQHAAAQLSPSELVAATLRVPCPSSTTAACSGHGSCDASTGKCLCGNGFSAKDCGVPLPAGVNHVGARPGKKKEGPESYGVAAVTTAQPAEDDSGSFAFLRAAKHMAQMLTVVVRHNTHGDASHLVLEAEAARTEALMKSIHRYHPGTPVVDAANDVASINEAVAAVATPFVLVLDTDVAEFHAETNLRFFVTMLLTTDVDVLGFHTLTGEPLTDRDVGAGAAADGAAPRVLLPGTWHMETPCTEFVHHMWAVRHQRAGYGYKRHDRFVALCDRTSSSFGFRAALLQAAGASPLAFFNDGVHDGVAVPVPVGHNNVTWPPRAAHGSGGGDEPEHAALVFNESMPANMAVADMFLSIKTRNAQIERLWRDANVTEIALVLAGHGAAPPASPRQLWHYAQNLAWLAEQSPTRLPGHVLVGTCSECLLKRRAYLVDADREALSYAFAERHQVELYTDPRGVTTGPVCVKTGGIYSHAKRGLYSPLCHRLQRQRDFLLLSRHWLDPTFAALPKLAAKGGKGGKVHHAYGVSLHHGNLFGALRLNSELLWETDGDFDFVAFNATHEQMMARWAALIKYATAAGFAIKVTYPEKPWYVAFTRDKTDFQLNARSPLDPQTRGRPPQVHNVTVAYQGRKAFVNGFQNPWRGIRADPGHDYRDRYLAQQGWVLAFTKKSVSCGVPGHNACLPPCNRRGNVLDHGRCDAADVGGDKALVAPFRDPILLFDSASGVNTHGTHREQGKDDWQQWRDAADGEAQRWAGHNVQFR
jgi:hypothetical protein